MRDRDGRVLCIGDEVRLDAFGPGLVTARVDRLYRGSGEDMAELTLLSSGELVLQGTRLLTLVAAVVPF